MVEPAEQARSAWCVCGCTGTTNGADSIPRLDRHLRRSKGAAGLCPQRNVEKGIQSPDQERVVARDAIKVVDAPTVEALGVRHPDLLLNFFLLERVEKVAKGSFERYMALFERIGSLLLLAVKDQGLTLGNGTV